MKLGSKRLATAIALLASSCGGDGERPDAAPLADAAPEPDASPPPYVCVFDYDLTLSSHACLATDGQPAFHCRTTVCDTYGWYDQCLGVAARAAVAECVRQGAMIGIASHADVDDCWTDKVTPIVDEQQFPEWTSSPRYGATGLDWSYPTLDDRSHWNCDDCAYTMDGSLGKPEGIRRVMRHYGLDPDSPAHRARVIFWDDTPSNVDQVRAELPEVTTVDVPRNESGAEGGCGLLPAEIDEGWRMRAAAR
jgi:hypothetical protein